MLCLALLHPGVSLDLPISPLYLIAMPDLTLPPLLAHEPESSPPFRWRLLLMPAILPILGMLIASAAATSGQDQRREIEALRVDRDIAHYQAVLARRS